MPRKNQHIVPNGDSWSVKSEGSAKATGNFPTQKEAIQRGIEIAKNQKSELIIHDRKGQIRDKKSYGNDPSPPKG